MNLYLGIDFGTSGARAIVIDAAATIKAQVQYLFATSSADLALDWQITLFTLLEQIPPELRQQVKAIAIDGTSATVLLCNAAGRPVTTPLLYNYACGQTVRENLKVIAPANHLVLSATSSLAKLLWMSQQSWFSEAKYFLHQADWLGFLLHGKLGISDYHNALKLGYDVEQLQYPSWLSNLSIMPLLPKVLVPGAPVGAVTAAISDRFGFSKDCLVCAGTTDSIAAFIASGAKKPGEAVTSLGSTLVLKLLSQTRVESACYGIYSHRYGDLWLSGGASNTGGAVLRSFFTDEQLEAFSRQIDPDQTSSLDYYPLLQPGDRFPINDPQLLPRLEPRPANSVEFLHGLLESMARIELQGYRLLQDLGATKLSQVYTAGGGAVNSSWTAIRSRYLQVPLLTPVHTAAAYGTALLAMRGVEK